MKLTTLKTKFLGRTIYYYKTIDSTQTEIFRRIESNSETNGMIVIADVQTRGRGTHGKIWHTDEENNIAFSFYVKTNCNIQKLEGITIEIARIIVDIFKEKYHIELEIKKPNDIVFNNKKIGGILTQTKISAEIVKYLVIGIGINTSQERFSKEIENIATSIKKEFDIDVDREEFIAEFCNRFEKILNSD